MTSGKDFVEFQQYYWHVYCQSIIKEFLKDETNILREKLMVSIGVVLRSVMDKDDQIDKQSFCGLKISSEEISFLSKE